MKSKGCTSKQQTLYYYSATTTTTATAAATAIPVIIETNGIKVKFSGNTQEKFQLN